MIRISRPRRRRSRGPVLLALLVLAAGTGSARAETVVRAEDFLSFGAADAALTTAAWDTVAGSLHLHAQGLLALGSLPVGGEARASARKDDILLVANGSANGVAVVDVSDPTNPVLVKTHALPAEARHIIVRGDQAYVALGGGLGVQVLNVAAPASPTTGVRVNLSGFTAETVAFGDWLYAALSAGGIGVMDITDPTQPVAGPAVDLTAWVRSLAVAGNHLFAASGDQLTVCSLAAPASPDSIAAITVSGTALSVATGNGLAFVGGSFGVDILDISVPSAPQPVQTVPLGGGSAFHIAVQGDSLFVADGNNGLHIIDISDPGQPVVVGQRASANYFYHTLLQGGLAWASNGVGGLLVLQADPLGLDPLRNRAVSVNLNPSGEPVLRARLAANDADSIRYEVTVNGGGTWQDIPPDDTWLVFEPQGGDLRWRATLVQTGPHPGPVCEDLTLTFERQHSYGEILSVADVPGDGGGRVRVTWSASRFDAAGQTPVITEYSVYRRYEAAKQAAYPPGDWEYLVTVPADREAVYAVSVPTLADSSGWGTNWAVFFVRARTATPGTYFDSPPDSGYSVNNLAPAPPAGFVVDYQPDLARLSWQPSLDPDFAHFRIYRAASPLTRPAPATLLAVTTGTSYDDAVAGFWYYQLTQVNLAGLESPPAVEPTPVAPTPAVGALVGRITPNPFNPATRIAYAVPPGGSRVRLDVLDSRGRVVAVLVDTWCEEGEHAAVWRGRDRRGREAASGVYTCRLQCGGAVTTRKMTLLR